MQREGCGLSKRAKIDDVGDMLARAVARVMGLPVEPLEKRRPKGYGWGANRSTAHHGPQHGYEDGCWSNGMRALEE